MYCRVVVRHESLEWEIINSIHTLEGRFREICRLGFFHGSTFETKSISTFLHVREVSDFSRIPRCRLQRGFKILTVAAA
jgi:hypothetical protein